MDALAELAAVERTYPHPAGPVAVLRGVDLAVRPGEVVLVQGPSGSGKTTLLNLLGALDLPTAGAVRLRGRSVAELNEAQRTELRRSLLGFVFQDALLISSLTVRGNLELAEVLARRPLDPARRDALLERVGLAARADHRPEELSGGEAQRAAIARACAHDPELLLADEPTGNLDREQGDAVAALLRELADERGLAVVIATHDDHLRAVAHRTLRLEDGRLT